MSLLCHYKVLFSFRCSSQKNEPVLEGEPPLTVQELLKEDKSNNNNVSIIGSALSGNGSDRCDYSWSHGGI